MSTPQQVAVLLALCAAHDTRFNTVDADQAQARIVAWSDTLADVPGEWALDYVRRVYRSEREWPLQAGEIRDAWLRARDRDAAVERARLPKPQGSPPPPELAELRDSLRAARLERQGVVSDAGS